MQETKEKRARLIIQEKVGKEEKGAERDTPIFGSFLSQPVLELFFGLLGWRELLRFVSLNKNMAHGFAREFALKHFSILIESRWCQGDIRWCETFPRPLRAVDTYETPGEVVQPWITDVIAYTNNLLLHTHVTRLVLHPSRDTNRFSSEFPVFPPRLQTLQLETASWHLTCLPTPSPSPSSSPSLMLHFLKKLVVTCRFSNIWLCTTMTLTPRLEFLGIQHYTERLDNVQWPETLSCLHTTVSSLLSPSLPFSPTSWSAFSFLSPPLFPASLRSLTLYGPSSTLLASFPTSLRHLDIRNNSVDFTSLPPLLEHLRVFSLTNKDSFAWPTTLQTLEIFRPSQQSFCSTLPPFLRSLVFVESRNYPNLFDLPESVTWITLGHSWRQRIESLEWDEGKGQLTIKEGYVVDKKKGHFRNLIFLIGLLEENRDRHLGGPLFIARRETKKEGRRKIRSLVYHVGPNGKRDLFDILMLRCVALFSVHVEPDRFEFCITGAKPWPRTLKKIRVGSTQYLKLVLFRKWSHIEWELENEIEEAIQKNMRWIESSATLIVGDEKVEEDEKAEEDKKAGARKWFLDDVKTLIVKNGVEGFLDCLEHCTSLTSLVLGNPLLDDKDEKGEEEQRIRSRRLFGFNPLLAGGRSLLHTKNGVYLPDSLRFLWIGSGYTYLTPRWPPNLELLSVRSLDDMHELPTSYWTQRYPAHQSFALPSKALVFEREAGGRFVGKYSSKADEQKQAVGGATFLAKFIPGTHDVYSASFSASPDLSRIEWPKTLRVLELFSASGSFAGLSLPSVMDRVVLKSTHQAYCYDVDIRWPRELHYLEFCGCDRLSKRFLDQFPWPRGLWSIFCRGSRYYNRPAVISIPRSLFPFSSATGNNEDAEDEEEEEEESEKEESSDAEQEEEYETDREDEEDEEKEKEN